MATPKQKKRAKIIGKTRTVKDELLAAGYSPSTAEKQPPSVMKARGWLELIEEKLPDEELFDVHRKALNATKPIGALVLVKKDGEQDIVYKDNEGMIEVDDIPTQLRAVELAYKAKGRLSSNGTTSMEFKKGDQSFKITVTRGKTA